jgi:mannitol-1-phosphate 5-dehydrogenase
MRVVIIGPGRIGCGYLAPLFQSAGCEVVLAARDEARAERIRRSGHFTVRITAPPGANGNGNGDTNGNGSKTGHRCGTEGRRLLVETPPVVSITSPDFVEAVATADLVCTAVGVGRIRSLGSALASGLAARPAGRPVDVWTVENGDCAPQLEADVRAAAEADGLVLTSVSFAGAIANVAVARGSWRTAPRCPEFVGDSFRSLLVDERGLLTGVPELPDVRGTGSYLAHLHEKLYVFNAGHAICAYLGWLRRHGTIAEASADPSLRPLIAGSMLEARRALLAAHPSLGTDLHGRVAEVLARFGDGELADPIERVAREPIRKLASGDRLLGPAELIRRRTGRLPKYFALAVAGALLYRNEDDEQSLELGAALARKGVMAVLESVCGLPPSHRFAKAVAARYRSFIITEDETIFPAVHARPVRATARRARAGSAVGARR